MNSSDRTFVSVHKRKRAHCVRTPGWWQAFKRFIGANALLSCYALCAAALPPIGITAVDPRPLSPLARVTNGLSIVLDKAYISRSGGIWEVSSTEVAFRAVPPGGSVTRIVEAVDKNLYFAVSGGPAFLYRLDNPTTPLVTWDKIPFFEDSSDIFFETMIVGIDRNLNVLGNSRIPGAFYGSTVRFNLDGTLTGWGNNAIGLELNDVTLSGFAVGKAHVPNTLVDTGALWNPDGDITFRCCTPISVADRLDGDGVNVGFMGFVHSTGETLRTGITYGDSLIEVKDLDGQFLYGGAYVSQSEFAIINLNGGGVYGYYPGLVPGKPNAALPIEEIFPELAAVDFAHISKPYSVGGNVYMALTGNDGLILFGAADPSLVPEPTAAALLLVGSLALIGVRENCPSH